MSLVLQADAPPFRREPDGALRVGDSRVLLELVIHAFQDGATPESIVQRYPALSLPEVYAAIAYYLRHTEDIGQYLAEREQAAAGIRQQAAPPQADLTAIRQRLAQQRQRRTGHAATAG